MSRIHQFFKICSCHQKVSVFNYLKQPTFQWALPSTRHCFPSAELRPWGASGWPPPALWSVLCGRAPRPREIQVSPHVTPGSGDSGGHAVITFAEAACLLRLMERYWLHSHPEVPGRVSVLCVGYCVQEAAGREKKEEIRETGTWWFWRGLKESKNRQRKWRELGETWLLRWEDVQRLSLAESCGCQECHRMQERELEAEPYLDCIRASYLKKKKLPGDIKEKQTSLYLWALFWHFGFCLSVSCRAGLSGLGSTVKEFECGNNCIIIFTNLDLKCSISLDYQRRQQITAEVAVTMTLLPVEIPDRFYITLHLKQTSWSISYLHFLPQSYSSYWTHSSLLLFNMRRTKAGIYCITI